jgi:hypothetical protein
MRMGPKRQLTTIHRREDIPAFTSEAEEHAFWATHELSDALWDQAEPFGADELPPPRSVTTPVVLHLDEHTLSRLKALARRQHKTYQTLLTELVTERLDQEEKGARRRRGLAEPKAE